VRLSIAFLLMIAVPLCCLTPCSAEVTVSTLAGSGVTGFADGPAARASFMLPMGVAYDRKGNLYVADGAAQRIRIVQTDGVVRTIAGSGQPDRSGTWVPGGYADGDGAHARFNRPSDVAVANDGRIFVADSYNHCIRVISSSGIVSTFAGSPARTTQTVGAHDVASFVMPTAVRLDRNGNLFVVDSGFVRKVDQAGNVSAVALTAAGNIPYAGLALSDASDGATLFVPTLDGLYIQHPDGRTEKFQAAYFSSQCVGKTSPGWWDCSGHADQIRAHRDVGSPWGVAALDDHTVAYADWKTGSIRLLDARYDTQQLLAGYPLGDESGRGDGHLDGPGAGASFNLPLGLAFGSDGSLAVADAGSRRIRILRGIDRVEPLSVGDLATLATVPNARTVVYAGDATVWQGTAWSDSIEGRLEALDDRKERVLPLVLDRALSDLAKLSPSATHRFDVLLLQLNVLDVAALAGFTPGQTLASSPAWRSKLESALQRLRDAARAAGAQFAVVVTPLPREVAPAAMFWARALDVSFEVPTETHTLATAVKNMGVPLIDATALFAQDAASATPSPLFATGEYEFAAGGRDIMAQAARAALHELKP
jgi:NHL repeat